MRRRRRLPPLMVVLPLVLLVGAFFPGAKGVQRLDLRPTAALAEERRHRRRWLQEQQQQQQHPHKAPSNTTADQSPPPMEPPEEWFHPYVRAVYAGLSSPGDPEHDDFVRFRHLSRYERVLRRDTRRPLDPHWHGNYSLPSIHRNTTTTNPGSNATAAPRGDSATGRRRRRLQSHVFLGHRNIRNIPQGDSSSATTLDSISSSTTTTGTVSGGQFNHYQGIPLSQGYGTHYVHLWVGSPIPQRQSVIVDTGSHFTAFPCTGCSDCGQEHHTDPYFDPSQSKTFRPLECPLECREHAVCVPVEREAGSETTPATKTEKRCEFTQSYTEGSSWKAYQAKDTVYLGGPDVLEAANPLDRQYSLGFMFGCLQKETGLFVTQLADGIMGMSAHEATFTKQLYNHGKLEYNMFAMCFRRELGTSKRGVTAGSMTLGGVSSSLDTSPMVFARNTQSYGWFTVYVQNIYIAKNGGSEFLLDSKDKLENIVRIPIDLERINSGKGVIVDSGTTDSYLNANVMPAFVKVWKQVTGIEYSHGPVFLTQSQLKRLPTILIQCQTAMGSSTNTLSNGPVLGQVGLLDPPRSTDVLLAIPAEHYMEYSPALKLYTSRLYFTETKGGVLGANAMQGHNVLFDWHHGRIGFSQSSCAYDLLAHEHHVNFASETYKQGDCVLGPPVLTRSCLESVDASVCHASDKPDNIDIVGTEVWTRLVESPGSDGASCEQVVAESNLRQDLQMDPSVVECSFNGLCTEYRPCKLPCLQVMEKTTLTESVPPATKATSGDVNLRNQTEKTVPPSIPPVGPDRKGGHKPPTTACGDSFWSACDHYCQQSRLISVPSDEETGVCLETDRSSRECHVDACGRTDPCVVPFLVHAIIVLEHKDEVVSGSLGMLFREEEKRVESRQGKGEGEEWTPAFLERFQKEFTRVSHLPEFSSIAARRRLFFEGDVDVLVVRPWHSDDPEWDEESENNTGDLQSQGIQLILQVSIANPKAHKVRTGSKHRNLLQEVGVLWKDLTQPFRAPKQSFVCNPADLYPLAKDAVELANGILENDGFGHRLIENMPSYGTARIVSSWTIGTQVYDDNVNFYGPIAISPYLLVVRVLCETSMIFFFISILSFAFQLFRTYRHLASRVLRLWCFGKNIRYHQVPSEEDNEVIAFVPRRTLSYDAGTSNDVEVEMLSLNSFSGMQKNRSTTATKRHNFLSQSRSMD